MKLYHGLYSFAENVERKVFVGRVDGITFQSESHQYGLDAQNPFKVADNGDASPTAYSKRFLTERLGESFFGCVGGRRGDGTYIALSAGRRGYFNFHIFRGDGLDVVDKQA